MAKSSKIPFPTGSVVATPGALHAMNKVTDNPEAGFKALIKRHRMGDFGEFRSYRDLKLTEEELELGPLATSNDLKLNIWGVEVGERVMSKYILSDGTVLWCITETNRSVTTFLLPEEY